VYNGNHFCTLERWWETQCDVIFCIPRMLFWMCNAITWLMPASAASCHAIPSLSTCWLRTWIILQAACPFPVPIIAKCQHLSCNHPLWQRFDTVYFLQTSPTVCYIISSVFIQEHCSNVRNLVLENYIMTT
jgi:hypothetical protein